MSNADAEQLRRRMAEIRESLHHDVQGIAENAREMSDWRYFVKKYPWASLGAAAALGFLAIPRRLETTSPDAETLATLARQHRLVVQPQAEAQARQHGLVGSLLSFASHLLLRAGITYAGQQAGKLFGRQAARPDPQSSAEASGDDTAVSGRYAK